MATKVFAVSLSAEADVHVASSGSKLERGLYLGELESLLPRVSQCKEART